MGRRKRLIWEALNTELDTDMRREPEFDSGRADHGVDGKWTKESKR